MSKYRFKTEEEFKKDGLWNKNSPVKWVSVMNKYLGKDIPDKYNNACTKQEKFRYDQWHIEPHDYVLKETAFVLPSKWCVKVDRNCQPEEVYKWRQMSWSDTGYISYSKNWDHRVHSNHTEITFEQFKQHVLKESPVVESPKTIDMKDIQEEVKKRFPIGCKFIPVDGDNTYTLIEDDCTYTINCYSIWAHSIHGSLYTNGKWATLVSLPETTKEMFYAGDYIVTLKVKDGQNCAKRNYCFKQRINLTGMAPVIDLKGSTSNSHGVMSFGKKEWLKDWRYATPEEAAEYERIGKPYDVTTLQTIPEYIECTSSKDSEPYFIKGNVYKVVKASPISSAELKCNILKDYKEHNILYTRLVDTDGTKLFKPSTKEAYEAQNTSKQLANKDLVKGEIYIYDGSQIAIYPEGPNVDFNGHYISNPKWMWTLPITHATEEQKALLRREIERNTTKTSKSEYIPQVGDYVVMENAGGWGYHPSNNGCIAIVEKISTREVGYGSDRVRVVSIGGQIINAKELNSVRFIDVPIIGHEKKPVFRKALPHELPNGLPKTTVITEWPSDPIVEQKINTLSIKKETFIDNVQSVDVILRTKRKSFKF